MFDKVLIEKSDRRLIILVMLILLDVFTFVAFDTYAALQGSAVSAHGPGDLSGIGWMFNIDHVSSMLGGQYSFSDAMAAISAFYWENSFIINKAAVILFSCVVVIGVYRFAPDLLPICYGYLLGVAGVGIYDGLQSIGVIGPGQLALLPFDFKLIPQAIMTICVVTGGIISLSKVAAYIFSQIVALQLFEEEAGLGRSTSRVPIIGRFMNKAGMPGVSEDHKLRIPKEYLPTYEKNIKELADLDTQNSIEAIQRSYDLVNQMAEKYGLDQYHVLYDIYKEKNNRRVKPGHTMASRDGIFEKGLE